MKKSILTTLAILSAYPFLAEDTPDGNRLILHKANGEQEVMIVDNIISMEIVSVPPTFAYMTLLNADDSSVTAAVAMSQECTHYKIACVTTSQAETIHDRQTFIIENYSVEGFADRDIEFIDLDPSTDYTLLSLAFDEFGFPCDISTLDFTTSEAAESGPVNVGDYLYRDGTWSAGLKRTKTPVGIIFSTDVTAADQARGYTHGYAVALKDIPELEWTLEADQNESGDSFNSTNDGDINDREGLSHTLKLLESADIHPAAVAARDYTPVAANTSGWFLPATGQLLDMTCNLGGIDRSSFIRSESGTAECSQEDAVIAIEGINSHLAGSGEGKFSPWSIYTWTSTERSVMAAYYIYANTLLNISVQSYYKDSKFAVRPIIAF